ncbi:MAG: 4-hydroxythreonine-4-phosphate dehydrogenase PdxA [Firmicutes bacterium HGW-Firmicutes-7]|nr:MAG: 4-hydroxythreonine-4-phosphate dehydrogenase PdxA [Firmicutes bacterium HGW-Firmicutes-7]
MKIPIIITMGDPAGVGPEIILSSYRDQEIKRIPLVVFGDFKVLQYMKEKIGNFDYELKKIENLDNLEFNEKILNVFDFDNINMAQYEPGKISSMCGQAAYEYVIASIENVKKGKGKAVTTAPLNKEALHMAGHKFPGHTEIFALSCQTNDFAMHLYDEKLSIIHVSTHVALADAIKNLSSERIEKVIELAHDNMKMILGREPRIAVAGINPHASENGLFGDQEEKYIIPAVEKMKKKVNVVGPIPPDTVFYRGIKGEFDIVVAMYHDQGHIPFKLFAFDTGVNTSAGLSILRTSVDHGTAFDIAGRGIAQDISLKNAIKLAEKLA